MTPQEMRELALLQMIEEKYGADRRRGVGLLIDELRQFRVDRVDRFVVKLERAVQYSHELGGVVREGVYARDFARQGADVVFEPKGSKGPDLGIRMGDEVANAEIKRLSMGSQSYRVKISPHGMWMRRMQSR